MSYQFTDNQTTINQTSSFGLAPNVAALVCYLFVPVTSILVLVTEKENRAVRFHAFQSLFLGLAITAISIVLSIAMSVLGGVLATISSALGLIVALVSLGVWLAFTVAIFAAWLMCLVKAHRGEQYQLPVVGKYAAQMIGK